MLSSTKMSVLPTMSSALFKITGVQRMWCVLSCCFPKAAGRDLDAVRPLGRSVPFLKAIMSTRCFVRFNNERIYDNWVCELLFRPDRSVVRMVIIIIIIKLGQWSHVGGVSCQRLALPRFTWSPQGKTHSTHTHRT